MGAIGIEVGQKLMELGWLRASDMGTVDIHTIPLAQQAVESLSSFGTARKLLLNAPILRYLELRHLSLNLLQIPLHRHPHQLQLLLLDIAVMAEMITAEKHVMEKLKVVHGAMKINPTVKDHVPELGVY